MRSFCCSATRFLSLAVLLASTVNQAWAQTQSGPAFAFEHQSTTLENGLTVISVRYPSPGVIAYYTIVRTGSRNEVEKGLSGFAHFFEHMMFRGTPTYSEDAYNDALKLLGADFNASTNDDFTQYYFTLPATALEQLVTLEADRFQNLQYDEAAFQKEARAVLGEYNKSASSPFLLLIETMQNLAYTRHTYKHTTIGFLADVKDMPNQYKYSRVFFDRWYQPENCTIVAVGDVSHDRVVELARKHYGPWRRGAETVTIPQEPEQDGPRHAELKWPSPTLPILAIAYHIPEGDPRSGDVAALDALAEAFFSDTSPLYNELVIKEQKVAVLQADAEMKRDPGLFTILALVRDSADIDHVRHRIEQTLSDAASLAIEDSRLESIKSHARYAFAASLDSPAAVAEAVVNAIGTAGRLEAINEFYESYARLRPEDLKRVAARYFDSDNQTIVTLTSEVSK